MAGLIETPDLTKQVKNPLGTGTIAESKAFGYDPTLGVVNNATDTVSGQLDTILNKDNPGITRARASAAQEAQSRGLINSTMGAQAGESAAIGAALPIASQDANTYSTQRLTNQQYGNAASQFTAGAANTGSQFNAGATNQFGLIGANTAAQKELIGAQGEQTRMTDAQQQAAQQELAKLQGSIQGGLQAQEITARKELQTMMSNTQISLQDKAALQQTAVTKMELLSRAELQQAQNSTTLSVADKQAAQSKYNSDLDANIRLSIQGIDNAFKTTYQTADVAAKTALLTLENETKLTLADMESTYKNAMQTSASATTMFQTGMNMIQNAVADSTINAADKTKLINGYLGWMKEGINVAGNISHVDTSWLLSGTFAAVT